jgi:hypothetical protein
MKFKITADKIAACFVIAVITGLATANALMAVKDANSNVERVSTQVFFNSLAIFFVTVLISGLMLRTIDWVHEILEKLRRIEMLAEKGADLRGKDSPQ